MSTVRRAPLRTVISYAGQLRALLNGACRRAELVGEIRRRARTAGSIDLLVVPQVMEQRGLLGDVGERRDMLVEVVDRLLKVGRFVAVDGESERSASRRGQRRLLFRTASGVLFPTTIYWTRPECWGVALAVTTGPEQYAQALVAPLRALTPRGRPGLLPNRFYVDPADGYALKLRESGAVVSMETEEEFLAQTAEDEYVVPERRR